MALTYTFYRFKLAMLLTSTPSVGACTYVTTERKSKLLEVFFFQTAMSLPVESFSSQCKRILCEEVLFLSNISSELNRLLWIFLYFRNPSSINLVLLLLHNYVPVFEVTQKMPHTTILQMLLNYLYFSSTQTNIMRSVSNYFSVQKVCFGFAQRRYSTARFDLFHGPIIIVRHHRKHAQISKNVQENLIATDDF